MQFNFVLPYTCNDQKKKKIHTNETCADSTDIVTLDVKASSNEIIKSV